MPPPELLAHLPADPTPDALLEGFLGWAEAVGLDLYEAQEAAILEVFAGSNVVLNTPTGSGKSLVALAAHFAALARGERSFYTAPIKALVGEKYLELCRVLGRDHVGMLTGDASVNSDAPIVCCTAEILANVALRHGAAADADRVCMDEFHFYSDPQRGAAWQIPILELSRSTFLVMSATLGDTAHLETELRARTGRPTVVVRSDERPVPLEFEYRETPLQETIQELLDTDRAPVYVVHFSQRAATERAQALTSLKVLSRDEKRALSDAIDGFRFDSSFGRDLARFLRHGIGVHHAGLLPRYRLLVEQLAQAGHLKLICGTDTLGVGINVPIRSVLFTQLCKYDGVTTRILTAREFQQVAGRAGRKGFDHQGHVWVQAPEHVIENQRMEARAAVDAKKRKKLVKRKPPERGYKHWNRSTFERLVDGEPETLESSFAVTHGMVLETLDRPGDGCAALKRLLLDNHEPRSRQRDHIRRAIHIYRSLVAAGVIEHLDGPDELGRHIRVDPDLQDDFRLDQPLSPFVLDVIAHLEGEPAGDDELDHALDVLSVVEAVLEDPVVVLLRQRDRARDELMARLKAEGVGYEERMDELARVEWPRPLAELLESRFSSFARSHPWVGDEAVRPKSVARDLYERGLTFREYVDDYGLKRSEGVLLRYLSDAYRVLVKNVPDQAKTAELDDLTAWLGAIVRQVDASLLEEWERLTDPSTVAPPDAGSRTSLDTAPPDITANTRAFRTMVRNELFRWVQLLARHEEDRLQEILDTWGAEDLRSAMAPYWEEHEEIRTDHDARGASHFQVTERETTWSVRQALLDPQGWAEWGLEATVDLLASRAQGRPVVVLDGIERLGEPPVA